MFVAKIQIIFPTLAVGDKVRFEVPMIDSKWIQLCIILWLCEVNYWESQTDESPEGIEPMHALLPMFTIQTTLCWYSFVFILISKPKWTQRHWTLSDILSDSNWKSSDILSDASAKHILRPGSDTHLFVCGELLSWGGGGERLLNSKGNFWHPLVCTRESNDNKNIIVMFWSMCEKFCCLCSISEEYLFFWNRTFDIYFEYILYLLRVVISYKASERTSFDNKKLSVDEPDIPEDFNETILFLA